MTGRHAIRTGTLKSPVAGQPNGLVRWEVTVAELLSGQLYATALYGKWHLGDQEGRLPNDRGFDEWYGIPRTTNEALFRTSAGYDPQIAPPQFILAGKKGEKSHQVEEYTLDARRRIDMEISRRTIDFMRRNVAAAKPFYAYVALTQVHFPSEETSVMTDNGWVQVPISRMIRDFQLSLNQYPPIPPVTPDPYTPPTRSSLPVQ
jgi:arylsulfatase